MSLKKLIFLVTFFHFQSILNAQSYYGVNAMCGPGLISIKPNFNNKYVFLTYTPNTFIGVGLFAGRKINEKLSIEGALNLLHMRSESTLLFRFGLANQTSNIDDYAFTFSNYYVTYLALPIQLTYTFNRLSIQGGYQINSTMASGAKDELYGQMNGVKYKSSHTYKSMSIDILNHGFCGGIYYQMAPKIQIGVQGFYGLNNIVQKASEKVFTGNVWYTAFSFKYNLKQKEKRH